MTLSKAAATAPTSPAPAPKGGRGAGPFGDDAELVAAVLAGDADAFGLIYERHVDDVARYLAFRLRDRAAAEDLTQDVFIKALRALPSLRDPRALHGWLLRIAHNVAANHWRASAMRSAECLDESDDPERPSAARRLGAPDALGAVDAEIQLDRLLAGVTLLTEDQREVLALRFGAGISLREAADLMRRSPAAVKQLQYRALEVLRAHVAEGAP